MTDCSQPEKTPRFSDEDLRLIRQISLEASKGSVMCRERRAAEVIRLMDLASEHPFTPKGQAYIDQAICLDPYKVQMIRAGFMLGTIPSPSHEKEEWKKYVAEAIKNAERAERMANPWLMSVGDKVDTYNRDGYTVRTTPNKDGEFTAIDPNGYPCYLNVDMVICVNGDNAEH